MPDKVLDFQMYLPLLVFCNNRGMDVFEERDI
jgi:hypothetical protein